MTFSHMRDQSRTLAMAFLAMLTVAACESVPPPAAQPSTAAASPTAAASAPEFTAAAEDPVSPAQSAAEQPAEPTPPAETVVEVYPEPDTITGLDRQALTEILGKPGFTRRDEPAEIWQYQAGVCTLDVFLYKDETGPTYRVTHFESRAVGAEPLSTKDCFVTLLKTAVEKQAG